MVTFSKQKEVLHDGHLLAQLLADCLQLLLQRKNIHPSIAGLGPLQSLHHVDQVYFQLGVEFQLAVVQRRPYQVLQQQQQN